MARLTAKTALKIQHTYHERIAKSDDALTELHIGKGAYMTYYDAVRLLPAGTYHQGNAGQRMWAGITDEGLEILLTKYNFQYNPRA